jgi:hypothetical protein
MEATDAKQILRIEIPLGCNEVSIYGDILKNILNCICYQL